MADALMIEHSILAGRLFRAREVFIEVETERFGPIKMQSSFPKLSLTPGSVRHPAQAKVGQHDAEIYGELLGRGEAELAEMATKGVI